MARDVDFKVTAEDDSDEGLRSAERRFEESQKRIRKISEDNQRNLRDDWERNFVKVGKTLESVFGRAAPKLAASVTDHLAAISGNIGPIIGVGVAAAAPIIGATLSAAVIGGAGVGGVIGGALLAARDPRVKAAGSALGQNLLSQLQEDASPFVDPMLRNIAKIEARSEAMNTRLKSVFGTSAGFVDPLVNGALDGIDGLLNGFDDLVKEGKPVIDGLGQSFAILGKSTGQALSTISGDSQDAASALVTLATGMGDAIESTGDMVRGLTELYGVISYLPSKISGASNAVADWAGLGDKAKETVSGAAAQTTRMAESLAESGREARAASGPIGTYTDKINALTTAGRGLYDATTQVGQATADLKKSLHDNGKSLDENTAKGRANRTALSQLAGALIGKYNAEVQANGEGRTSNKIAGENRAAFIALAGQFGVTKTQAANLATQMGLIPSKKNSDFYLNTHDAEGRAKAVSNAIGGIHGKTVSIGVTIARGQLNRVQNTLNRLGGSLYNSAGPAWAASDTSSAVSRTQAPTPINVTSTVVVDLDGSAFRSYTTRTVRAGRDRDAWRQEVGQR